MSWNQIFLLIFMELKQLTDWFLLSFLPIFRHLWTDDFVMKQYVCYQQKQDFGNLCLDVLMICTQQYPYIPHIMCNKKDSLKSKLEVLNRKKRIEINASKADGGEQT